MIIYKSEIDSLAAFNQIYYLHAPSPILLAVKCPTLNTLCLLLYDSFSKKYLMEIFQKNPFIKKVTDERYYCNKSSQIIVFKRNKCDTASEINTFHRILFLIFLRY